jgi:hypothetical protein
MPGYSSCRGAIFLTIVFSKAGAREHVVVASLNVHCSLLRRVRFPLSSACLFQSLLWHRPTVNILVRLLSTSLKLYPLVGESC